MGSQVPGFKQEAYVAVVDLILLSLIQFKRVRLLIIAKYHQRPQLISLIHLKSVLHSPQTRKCLH